MKPSQPAFRKGHVLVVDDDEAVRMRVRDLLEPTGLCTVSEASNGPDGLAAARNERPDLVLLDIMMPGMTGLTVCQLMRQDPLTREIPIIVLSAADEDRAMPSALDAGAEDYLPKPIPSAELKAKVRTIMDLNRYRSLTRERRRLRWLVEQASEALVMIDRKGHLLEANRRARELFNLPAIPGADALDVIGNHYEPDPPDAFERLRDEGFRPGEGFAVVRPESSLLAAHWLQVDLFADDNDARGELLLKFTDRTDSVHRNLETWTFQQMMSHKIRTPLNGMGSMLELLAECPSVSQDPDSSELLQIAQESNRRLEDTLTSILEYHRTLFHLATDPSAAEPVSWELLLRDSAVEARMDIDLLRISGEQDHHVPATLVEPMRQALIAVVDNYLKFSRAGAVGIDATLTSAHTLRLFAPGPAIPPEAIARLGRPYWQIEPRFSGEIPGMGLGLATARTMLRSLGAGLRFSASEQPTGLVVEFTLPETGNHDV
jgi:two-component system, cell cycle response regulator